MGSCGGNYGNGMLKVVSSANIYDKSRVRQIRHIIMQASMFSPPLPRRDVIDAYRELIMHRPSH